MVVLFQDPDTSLFLFGVCVIPSPTFSSSYQRHIFESLSNSHTPFFGVITLNKVLPANAVEVSRNKETFQLTFRYQNGEHQETVFVVISPSGAKTTNQLLNEEIESYEKESGKIEPWQKVKTDNPLRNRLSL